MKTYITPKARCIEFDLEAMIAASNEDGIMTLNEDYGGDEYFSNRRGSSIWDNE